MPTPTPRTDAYIWPLIYVGLGLAAWGVAVWRQPGDGNLGLGMVIAGLLGALVGAVMVVRRASLGDTAASNPASTGDRAR